MEQWRDVPGYPGYQASDAGRVRSVDRDVRTSNGQRRHYKSKVLSPAPSASGHLSVCCGKGHSVNVHLLVALAFLGPKPHPAAEVLHSPNPDPTMNTPSNLKWGSRSDNLREDYTRGVRQAPNPSLAAIRWGTAA